MIGLHFTKSFASLIVAQMFTQKPVVQYIGTVMNRPHAISRMRWNTFLTSDISLSKSFSRRCHISTATDIEPILCCSISLGPVKGCCNWVQTRQQLNCYVRYSWVIYDFAYVVCYQFHSYFISFQDFQGKTEYNLSWYSI